MGNPLAVKHSVFLLKLIIHEEKTKEITAVKEEAAPRFYNSLLSLWISDDTLFLVFDILLQTHT